MRRVVVLAVLAVVITGGVVGATAASSDTGQNGTGNGELAATQVGYSIDDVTVAEGDVATIDATLSDPGGSATIDVFDEGESFYEVAIEVTDENDDGTVELEMDTYRAGGWDGADPEDVFAGGDGTTVETVDRTNPPEGDPLPGQLPQGGYVLELLTDGDLQDANTLTVEERRTEGASVHALPEGSDPETVDELRNGMLEVDSVAMDDRVVVEIEATGLYAYLEDTSDLDPGTEGLALSVEGEADAFGNAPEFDVESGELFTSPEDGVFYAVLDTDGEDVEVDEEYEAEFTIDDDNPYVDDDETVRASFELEERTLEFDPSSPELGSEPNAHLTGESSMLPGTEITVTADSHPHVVNEREDTEIRNDGTFEVAFDTSELEAGDEIELEVVSDGETVEETVATVVEEASAEIELRDLEYPAEIEAGETHTATIVLENSGEEAGEAVVFVGHDGAVTEDVATVEPGDTTAVESAFVFEEPGTSELVVVVDGPDVETTERFEEIEVTESDVDAAEVTVESIDVPAEVAAGETHRATVVLGNDGDASGYAMVDAFVDGQYVDGRDVEVDPGGVSEVDLEYVPDDPGTDDYLVVVGSDSEYTEETQTVEVLEVDEAGADISVDSMDIPGEVRTGETHRTTVVLENHGDSSGEAVVEAFADGQPADDGTVTVEPGSVSEVDLEYVPDDPGTDDYVLIVDGPDVDDTDEFRAIEVLDGPDVGIEDVDHPDEIPEDGGPISTVTVENEGDVVDLEANMSIDGERVDGTDLTLEADETRDVELEGPDDLEPGEYEYEVAVGGERESEDVTLEAGDADDGDAGGDGTEQTVAFGQDVDSQPGFTVGAAVLALALVVLVRRLE